VSETAFRPVGGEHVAVLDARGCWLEKVTTGPWEHGGNFAVVRVRWLDEPEQDNDIAWPLDSVVRYDECAGPVLSHADYRVTFPSSTSPGGDK
jgi:hypothetical protein